MTTSPKRTEKTALLDKIDEMYNLIDAFYLVRDELYKRKVWDAYYPVEEIIDELNDKVDKMTEEFQKIRNGE